MNQPYFDLLVEPVETTLEPVFQLLFLFYLLVGQVVLLLAWRAATPRDFTTSRVGKVVFALFLLVGQAVLLFAWPTLMTAWIKADPIARADVVVVLHFGFVLSVLLSLLLVFVGWFLDWKWTRNFWFRVAQLVAIEIVAGQAIVGLDCPLTTLECDLRGGLAKFKLMEGASSLGKFANNALYLRGVPTSAFPYIYGSVGLLVLLTWVLAPPRVPWVTQETKA